MNEQSIRTAIETGHPFSCYPDSSSLENQVRFAYNDALRLRGQGNQDAATEEQCVRTIAKTLYEDYPSLTDNELPIIMKAGVSGELGKENWVSGASVLQWIRLYSRCQMRLNVVDEKHDERRNARPTQEEETARNEQSWVDGYEKGKESCAQYGTIFCAAGFSMPMYPAMIYDEFRRRGVIQEPTAEARQYAEKKADEYNMNNPQKAMLLMPLDALKLQREDLIKAFLLEYYYKDIINPINN